MWFEGAVEVALRGHATWLRWRLGRLHAITGRSRRGRGHGPRRGGPRCDGPSRGGPALNARNTGIHGWFIPAVRGQQARLAGLRGGAHLKCLRLSKWAVSLNLFLEGQVGWWSSGLCRCPHQRRLKRLPVQRPSLLLPMTQQSEAFSLFPLSDV